MQLADGQYSFRDQPLYYLGKIYTIQVGSFDACLVDRCVMISDSFPFSLSHAIFGHVRAMAICFVRVLALALLIYL